MTTKERLHRLIEELADDDLRAAERVLLALRATVDPVSTALDQAPVDDEPDQDDADGGLTEAREERPISHAPAKRRLLDD